MLRHPFPYLLLCLLLLIILSACGGGNDSGAGSESGTGTLTLGISDAPVDHAEAVIVAFSGVEIQPANGERITIHYSKPKTIDLLSLTGGLRDYLLNGETLAAGQYNWIRLMVNAEFDNQMDSYITLTGGTQIELRIPSGSQTGLKLNTPFIIPANGHVDLTIDFDLRKSVHNPRGQPGYFLQPALRLAITDESGSISGKVNPTMLSAASCSTGVNSDAVYVFSGHGITPDDVDGTEPEPISSAAVTLNGNGEYIYKAAFLEPGPYTVAFTCQADLDEPDEDNLLFFPARASVYVNAGKNTVQDF